MKVKAVIAQKRAQFTHIFVNDIIAINVGTSLKECLTFEFYNGSQKGKSG